MPGQDSSTRIRKPRSAQPEAHNRPSRRRVMLVVSALLVLISLLFVYWPKDAAGPALRRLAESGSAGGYNVLLVTLDTLRADRLGCYGYQKAVTPVIDRLAREGVRFEQAVTAVPITLPSHATIMTGRYPPRHGVRDNGTFHLPPEQTTLAETLQGHGYATAAFIAAFVLDARYGLDQGFDHYDDDLDLRHRLPTPIATGNPERPADVVVDSALAWLDTHNQ